MACSWNGSGGILRWVILVPYPGGAPVDFISGPVNSQVGSDPELVFVRLFRLCDGSGTINLVKAIVFKAIMLSMIARARMDRGRFSSTPCN